MLKYAKIENEETKQCSVGLGTNTDFYKSIGMVEMEVEQAYNGQWYLAGYCPVKPAPTREEISQLRATAYLKIDKLHAERDRKTILGTWTSENETKYIEKVKTMSAEIAEKYPYPEEKVEEEPVQLELPLMV